MTDYGQLLAPARRAVADACRVCRQIQTAVEQVRSMTKDDRSPVTVADFAAQAIVGRTLREAFGDEVVLVAEEVSTFLREEEHGAHLDATLAAVRGIWPDITAEQMLAEIDVGAGDTHHRAFWTLDPIDGTKGFLRGQQYAIALAYIEHGEPTLGVMGCPNLPRDFSRPLDETDPRGAVYFAVKGQGLYETPADESHDADDPLHIQRPGRERSEPVSICMSVEKAHSNFDDTDRIIEHLASKGWTIGDPARIDSQAKYAVVARGQADAYLRMPTKKDYTERIWDHAAGAVVAGEAGCFATDIHGRALDFAHGRGLEKNRGILCAPPRLHGAILGAIEELGLGG
jgi:3'(2'), 5'-bisphosphate nucleotidase